MITKTPLPLCVCHVARVCRGLTGTFKVANGSGPLNQVTAGERLRGDFKLVEIQQRILSRSLAYLQTGKKVTFWGNQIALK